MYEIILLKFFSIFSFVMEKQNFPWIVAYMKVGGSKLGLGNEMDKRNNSDTEILETNNNSNLSF